MWRKSTHSSHADCVEVRPTGDGRVELRNSNQPWAGAMSFPPAALAAFVDACRAGELDDLTGPTR